MNFHYTWQEHHAAEGSFIIPLSYHQQYEHYGRANLRGGSDTSAN
jgi:hypothetical protein